MEASVVIYEKKCTQHGYEKSYLLVPDHGHLSIAIMAIFIKKVSKNKS